MATTSQPDFTIHRASPKDAKAVASLGAHVFAVTFGHSVPSEQLQAYLQESYSVAATARDISDPTKLMLLATTSDGSLAGFALLNYGTSEPCIAHLEKLVELQRIYVHPGTHGKGIGKALVKQLEVIAREQMLKHIWLGVWEDNHKAKKLYEKIGYKMVGEHDFVIGGVVQTDYIMLKKL